MAITKIGAPLSGIRGTLGGIVYSENGTGTYAKQWAMCNNPRTPKQSTERGYLARMPGLWSALTDAQRAAWRTFAADPAQELTNPLGEAYFASGFNWFCKCNIRLLRVARATITAVPTQARPAAPTILELRVTPPGSESDQCNGGIVTASSQEPVQVPARAFDNNIATTWQTLTGNPTGWIQYVFTAPLVIRKYRIYTAAGWASQRPKDWTLQAKNNGGWDDIDTVTSFVFTDNAWHTFYAVNDISTDTYRLNVTANNGHALFLSIWEIEMYLGLEDSSMVKYTEDNFDDAPDYDLVLHVSQGRSIGMSTQYPGFLETLALQDPDRHHEEFQDQLEAIAGIISEQRSWFGQLYRQTREGLRSSADTDMTITEEP